MRLFFLGGAGEVGASCVLVEIAGKRILLDCGMRMKGEALPNLQTVQDQGALDAIVLSHAHMDHSGSLPVIARAFPAAPLFMTHPTQALIRVLLYDSLKIMEHEGELPLFDEKHVVQMLACVQARGFDDPLRIFDDADVELTFHPAGHILGAACIHLSSGSDGSLFYSGDISAAPQKTINGLAVPANLRPDVCIMESTYGNRLHSSRDVEERRLVEMAAEVLSAGGKMLIPAFAVGRAQEVILLLKAAINRAALPPCRIYVDGMVRAVCSVYGSFPNYLSRRLAERIWDGREVFYADNVVAVARREQREQILSSPEPCVIVASSGMLSGGASAWYAERLAGDPNACIAITGYQDEESPGRQLQELFNAEAADDERRWSVNGKEMPLACRTGTYGLSAHADKTQIQALIRRLNPQRIFLVHGDSAAVSALEADVAGEFRGRVSVPSNGAGYYIHARAGQRRPARELPACLNERGIPDDDGLRRLHDHLDSATGPWTAVELLHIWGTATPGADDERTMTDRLNASPLFACDSRRLYLFHLADDEPAAAEPQSFMEINAMLARAQEMFPPETGCYRTGARLEQQITRLTFRFPRVARERYADRFAEFEAETGWTIELNENPDTSYLQPLLQQLLGDEVALAGKVAWKLDQNQVEVAFSRAPVNLDEFSQRFRDETGMNLVIRLPGRKDVLDTAAAPGGEPTAVPPTMSQQDAFAAIEHVFEPAGVTIYKQSVKTDVHGQYIEVQLLTPALGQRYDGWFAGLREETGWRIVASAHPRQQDLIAIARRPFDECGIAIAKGPSILPGGVVRIKLAGPIPDDLEELRSEFEETTGYNLQIIYPQAHESSDFE